MIINVLVGLICFVVGIVCGAVIMALLVFVKNIDENTYSDIRRINNMK